VVELVDTTDSKSVAFAGVPVQVRPLVPDTIPIASEEIHFNLFIHEVR